MSSDGLKLNDWSDMSTIAGLFVALLGVGGGMKVSGFRVGPLRAISLALRSKFWIKNNTQDSVRHLEMRKLWNAVSTCTNKAQYVVVEGPKGVGKSCMIDTCFSKSMGVIRCKIPPGTLQKAVLYDCYEAINGGGSTLFPPEPNVRRVLFWYNIFTFGNYPTIIIAVSERPPDTKPAQLTGAVRMLAELGLKVVVDASPNSLPPDLLTTGRQKTLHVDGMSNEEIRSLPQLQNLLKQLDEANLSDVVLKLLGGNPAQWERLSDSVLLSSESSIHEVVRNFLCEMISTVALECNTISTYEPKFDKIFELLSENEYVNQTVLKEMQVVLPSPCKVLRLRKVIGKGSEVQVQPIDSMTAFVLKHGCSVKASEDALDELMSKPK